MRVIESPKYSVTSVSFQTVTLHDGFEELTIAIGPHVLEVGDRVSIALHRETAIKEIET